MLMVVVATGNHQHLDKISTSWAILLLFLVSLTKTNGYINDPAISENCRLPLSPAGAGYQRSRVLNEVVDEHGPRAVLVVV